ncbi:hypothetical protein CDL15_Pgr023128 [Punica granatum]|uniref:BHLH domain-containing protein n=1 Tax=Punica granatum TaxID=22663 RepID=A0A218X4U3_PUNGR|nr:hypothetical protein CDL15_Pgr023128 [Punica granatum]
MTRDLATPVCRSAHDFEELVWENGTLFVRGTRDQNNNVLSSGYTGFSNNNRAGHEQVNKDGAERALRLGNLPHEFMFTGDASKPNNNDSRPHQTSTSCLGPGFDSNRYLLPTTGVSEPRSRSLGEMNRVNFSFFLGINSLINEANGQGSRSNRSRFGALPKAETDKLNKMPSSEYKNQTGSQKRPVHVLETETEVVEAAPLCFGAGGGDFLVPDEHSQAIGNHFIDDHDIQNSTFDDDHQVPGPDSSIEASNALLRKLKRRCEESESTYLNEDEDEEMEDHKRRAIHYSGGRVGAKRRRSASHNLSEKKRRDKINKRMRALQELLPNCNKVDKASVLDETIEYVKTLQLQLQMMSTGTRLFAPTMAMLPTGIPQMPMPYLNQFSTVSAGMGMRMGPAFAQGPTHQFPLPGPGTTAFAGGFQPMGCMPYIPLLGGHPALSSLMNGADFSRAAVTPNDQLGSAVISGSNDSKPEQEFLGTRGQIRKEDSRYFE